MNELDGWLRSHETSFRHQTTPSALIGDVPKHNSAQDRARALETFGSLPVAGEIGAGTRDGAEARGGLTLPAAFRS